MATVDQNKNVVPEDETTHPGGKPTQEELYARAFIPPPRDHEGLTPQGVGVFLPGTLEPRTPGVAGYVPGLGHVDTDDTSYQQIADKQQHLADEDKPAEGDVLPAEAAAAREQAEDVTKAASGDFEDVATADDDGPKPKAPAARSDDKSSAKADDKAKKDGK